MSGLCQSGYRLKTLYLTLALWSKTYFNLSVKDKVLDFHREKKVHTFTNFQPWAISTTADCSAAATKGKATIGDVCLGRR